MGVVVGWYLVVGDFFFFFFVGWWLGWWCLCVCVCVCVGGVDVPRFSTV